MNSPIFTLPGRTTWRDRLSAFWLAWKYVAVAVLLLAISLTGNALQWSNHYAYKQTVKANQAKAYAQAESAQLNKILDAVRDVGSWKASDDQELMDQLASIKQQRSTHTVEYRQQTVIQPLPANCAPGQGRVDAINRALGPQESAK